MKYFRLLLVVSLIARGLGSAAAQAAELGNLVYNGDFEVTSPDAGTAGLPGWAMWGAEKWKIPANYTRDTTQAHGGAAAMRIFHPKGSAGYICTQPQHAIQPRAGMTYTISFFARTDHPGRTRFGTWAYSDVDPLVVAPSPGAWDIDLTRQWTRYEFVIREGRDFHADSSRYVLLSFHAATDPAIERTMWVDDVSVTESGNPPGTLQLLDPTSIPCETLPHRLRPGDRLEFSVDARQPGGAVNPMVAGISFHRVAGHTGTPFDRDGNYTLSPELERAITDLHLPLSRFYAVGAEKFSVEQAIDKIADLCRRIDLPMEHVVLELEEQSARSKLAPEVWAQAVRHSVSMKYGFRYWEVGNEVYSALFMDAAQKEHAFATPDDYVTHLKQVSAAVKAVQPAARIGASIAFENTRWGNYVLRAAAGSYDFVCPHLYAMPNVYTDSFQDVTLSANYRILNSVERLNALIRAYNPGRAVCILDTEWGLSGMGRHDEEPDDVVRNSNVMGVVHRAVRLMYYARENLVGGASAWSLLVRVKSPGFGVLASDAPDKWLMLYDLYDQFNQHLGKTMLNPEGTAPWNEVKDEPSASGPLTPVLVTLGGDKGSLYLIAANGSWDRPVPCRMTVKNMQLSSAKAVALSQDSLDASPVLEHKEDALADIPVRVEAETVTLTLPPHAVVFVKADR